MSIKSNSFVTPEMASDAMLTPEKDRIAAEAALPTVPGLYRDVNAEPEQLEYNYWILTQDGNWYDHDGHTEPKKYNFVLTLLGITFEKVEIN